MGQKAPRVCTESVAIRHLETLIKQLPGNATVTVDYDDGKSASGIVCVRPTVQSFRDRDGKEGLNGVLRLEDANAPGGEHHIWLDQIQRVRQRMAYTSRRAA